MSRKPHSRFLTALTASSLVALALPQAAQAQDAQRIRVRGAIESLSGDTLVVKTREGNDATVALKAGWKVGGIKKLSSRISNPAISSASLRFRRAQARTGRSRC